MLKYNNIQSAVICKICGKIKKVVFGEGSTLIFERLNTQTLEYYKRRRRCPELVEGRAGNYPEA